MAKGNDIAYLSDILVLAHASEKALDEAYNYGMSEPGSFGHVCNIRSATRALPLLVAGVEDIAKIADASHQGWAEVALMFDDPVYDKHPEKKTKRRELAMTNFEDLPEDEKEKDRVAARALVKTWKKLAR